MKRLSEIPANSPLIEQAQRLIHAAPQIPDSPVRMQRIRRAIEQQGSAAPSGAIAAVLTRAPAFAIAGVLLLFGASAFAAVRVWEHWSVSVPAAPSSVDAVQLAVPRSGAKLVVEDVGSQTQPVVTAANEPAAFVPPSASTTTTTTEQSAIREPVRARRFDDGQRSRRSHRRHKLSRAGHRSSAHATATSVAAATLETPETTEQPAATTTAVAQASQASRAEPAEEPEAIPEPARLSRAAKRSSDSELVVRAVETLRRDHEPAEAAQLLEKYRARNPAGVLAEEVLSLQIEAAAAANDPRSRSFAREYLARYPDGRYRERAQRALGGAVP